MKNPALLKTLSTYPTHGPFALCAELQELYGELKRTHEWPALTATLPAANLAGSAGGGETQQSGTPNNSRRKNPDGRKCYKCGSDTHLANSELCRHHHNYRGTSNNTPQSSPTSKGGGNEPNSSSGTNNTSTVPPSSAPASVWKYIWPANHDEVIEVNNKKYYFCKFCVCHTSGKVGFYNRSHTSSNHQAGRGIGSRPNNSDSSSSTSSTAASSGTESSDTTNDNAQGNMTPIPESHDDNAETASLAGSQVDPDPNGLEYQGAFLSEDLDYSCHPHIVLTALSTQQ